MTPDPTKPSESEASTPPTLEAACAPGLSSKERAQQYLGELLGGWNDSRIGLDTWTKALVQILDAHARSEIKRVTAFLDEYEAQARESQRSGYDDSNHGDSENRGSDQACIDIAERIRKELGP